VAVEGGRGGRGVDVVRRGVDEAALGRPGVAVEVAMRRAGGGEVAAEGPPVHRSQLVGVAAAVLCPLRPSGASSWGTARRGRPSGLALMCPPRL